MEDNLPISEVHLPKPALKVKQVRQKLRNIGFHSFVEYKTESSK